MVAIIAIAIVLAAEIARLTIANSVAETRPDLAKTLAPGHPSVLASTAMAEVGEAAAYARTPPEAAMRRLREVARLAPLRPEPFLVQAAIAQKESDLARAERLLLEARRRDPRSEAGRYLLADTWIRQGRIDDGLAEMAILARLLPGSAAQLAPALAQYARSPGGVERLKRILSANPQLSDPLLNALAENPDNLNIILQLESPGPTAAGKRSPDWQTKLLSGLIDRGDYERAYALWRRFSGFAGQRPLLFNGDFRRVSAPPPFNWSFASGAAGVAEATGGQMRVLHYGRDNATLARQLLLLTPGRYRLSVPVSGNASPGALAWVVSCAPKGARLMQLAVASAPVLGTFEVPASGCPAQILALNGSAQDMPRESDLLLGPASLKRVGG